MLLCIGARFCIQCALRRSTWPVADMEGDIGMLDTTMICIMHTVLIGIVSRVMTVIGELVEAAHPSNKKAARSRLKQRSVAYAFSNGVKSIEGWETGVPTVRTWTADAYKAAFVPYMLAALSTKPDSLIPDAAQRAALRNVCDPLHALIAQLWSGCISYGDAQEGGLIDKLVEK